MYAIIAVTADDQPVGKKQKARLEEGYHEAGYRTGWQVICNSLCALLGTALWNIYFVPLSIHAQMAKSIGFEASADSPVYAPGSWCPTDGNVGGGVSRLLYYAILGQLGCCLGDTLASELGILSRSQPRLITTLRPVPRGTNGAITLEGSVWSIIGGLLVGTGMGVSLIGENGRCGWGAVAENMGWGAMAGGLGSMVDSVVGASLQQSVGSSGSVIAGLNILSNSGVNLVSSTLTALLIGGMTSVR